MVNWKVEKFLIVLGSIFYALFGMYSVAGLIGLLFAGMIGEMVGVFVESYRDSVLLMILL
ncbi:hypothetical protein [Amphibacillus jilinensis]|uniref:hypothetical protein n=1 Tax=Amphibacillus jilinensis TaxID=1216008 RepID=UPI00031F5563|nr:hypothetical protein [Amphibacillus jilinensis]